MEEKIMENLFQNCLEFQTLLKKAREEHSIEYRKNEGGLNSFRILLDSIITDLTFQFTNKIENINEAQSYQLNLSLSLIRSHFIINDLILEGEIIEAEVLIRKQLENLTRLHEVDEKPLNKLLGKTPNVINTFQKFAKKAYMDLSEVAHFGRPRVGQLMGYQTAEDGKAGPSLLPLFTSHAFEIYKTYGAIMTLFVNWLIDFEEKMYVENDFIDLHRDLLKMLYASAFKAGVLLINPEGDE